MNFINRKDELLCLNEISREKSAQFLVVYGRRRIGKTALITYWLKQNQKITSVYWVAHRNSPSLLLDKFSQLLCDSIEGIPSNTKFRDWEAALRFIFKKSLKQKLILAIDEFPYLIDSFPEFTSILQMLWDEYHYESKLILIVSGSHYHMMKKIFTSGEGPLYGRSTADLFLDEIKPDHLCQFLPLYSSEQLIETYSIIGGVPKYLEMWDDKKPIHKNIETLLLSPVTIFRQEALFLIQDEISEPRTYIAILEAIGTGAKTPKAISETTGILYNHIGKYLKVLLDLRYIRKLIPIENSKPTHSRSGHYEIRDPYLRFFFTFIYPHLEWIEQGRIKHLMKFIEKQMPSYIGKSGYEEMARKKITKMGDNGLLSFSPEYIGRIWNKVVEIDVVAINHKEKVVLLGECKWTSKKHSAELLKSLVLKCKKLNKLKDYKFHYALFSKNGFTKPFIKEAKEKNVMLFHGAEFKLI